MTIEETGKVHSSHTSQAKENNNGKNNAAAKPGRVSCDQRPGVCLWTTIMSPVPLLDSIKRRSFFAAFDVQWWGIDQSPRIQVKSWVVTMKGITCLPYLYPGTCMPIRGLCLPLFM